MSTEITVTKPTTLKGWIESPDFRAAIAQALPAVCTPERFLRVALTALNRTPKLRECTRESVLGCLLASAQLGLEPDGRHAHLVPYGATCTLVPDYKGLVALAYRSGMVSSIHADVVRTGDIFTYDMGRATCHIPYFLRVDPGKPQSAGEIIAAYCSVRMKDGSEASQVMSLEEIEAVRKRSRAGGNGPWVTDWPEMAKKTVFKRLSKWLPLSAELRDAVAMDDEPEVAPKNEPKPAVVVDMFEGGEEVRDGNS